MNSKKKAIGQIDWISSYPKSGNTWMRILLGNYFNTSDEPAGLNDMVVSMMIGPKRRWFDEFIGLSSSDLTDDEVLELRPFVYDMLMAELPARHWVKVHDAQRQLANGRWLLPPEASSCAIYIVRNPLDVAVSSAFHDGRVDMDRAIARLGDPENKTRGSGTQLCQVLGDWSGHVTSWIDASPIPVITVRYEDMLQDTARELSRVLAFARPGEQVDAAKVARAVESSAFDKLKAAEAETGFRESGKRQRAFFREGRAGGWKDHLTAEQAERIWRDHSATMARFGYGLD